MSNESNSPDPWAILDELTGAGGRTADVDGDIGPVAFYGRCSTEDNQDPRTSRAWQRSNAAKFVETLGGVITEDYFDIGQSRSVPGTGAVRAPDCWPR